DFLPNTFFEQPIVDANPNDSVCGNVYDLQAISTMGTGLWTGPPNTSFGDASSPNTTAQIAFSGLSQVNATFTWHEQNSFCQAEDDVLIVYSTYPNAAAGLDDWTCGIAYTFDADILGYEYAMGTWKTDFSNADFDDKHDPNATVTLPNTGSFPGQPQAGTFGDSSFIAIPFTWVMDNNRCTDEDIVLITFYQIPVAFTGPDTSVCGKVYDMRAEYSIGSSKGQWTMIQGPGGSTVPPTWSDDTDPHATVQVPLHGEYIFKWKEDNLHNQTCTTEDQIVIFFIEIPDVDAGPDKYICGNSTNLEAINSTGTGEWLSAQAYIDDITDPLSYTEYGLTGTNDTVTYVWQEYNEHNGIQCVSNSEVDIVFMIVPESEVFFIPGTSTDHVCGKLETIDYNILVGVEPGITGPNVLAYWIGDDSNFYPNSFAKDPDSVRVGNYGVHEFNWVIENHHGDSVCPDTSITIIVDFIEQPVADAGPLYDTACIDSINPYYQFQGNWTTSTGDSIAGKWITTSPNQVSFWYINPIDPDTSLSDSLPNNYVYVNYIDPNTPEVYDLVWQEENYGSGVNGNLPDFCLDWDTTTVTFAPRPTGKVRAIYEPHCIGWPAKLSADEDYSIEAWDWSDIDDGNIIYAHNATLDSVGKGPVFVKWPEAQAGDEHYIRLITENEWACISRATADTIREPEKVPVEMEIEPAKCGDLNGEIALTTPPEFQQPHIYNWIKIDSLGFTYSDNTADTQIELETGDHYFSANARSLVMPNDSNYRCTDTFMVHVHDTGYIAALYQIQLTDTAEGIAPHTMEFTNVSYMVDSTYTTPDIVHFSHLINEPIPFEELDAEYEWRFYKLGFDTLLDYNTPVTIPPGLDPVQINGEFFVEDVNPSVEFDDAGYYIVELLARSDFGCTDTLRDGYYFIDAKSDIVPGVNVFTPNGDGVNDFLEFETKTLRSMHGKIFNRWGKLLFEWTWNENDQVPNPGWWDGKLENGQDAATGVYFYVIEGVGLDGNEFTGEDYAKAFHLIRDKQ
ncbi:MAG: gliding motility-associated C-terminal domain-containing protein, partial [Bacteroidota bacterium]|nr:gliding motility-associated C-terminal domain-containing protein [Bacteroidota bacterium]